MSSIRDQEHGYRRGLVLGLTMAEIAVLVIFVLLLVLGALLSRQAREADKLRQRNVELEASAAEVRRIADAVGRDPEKIIQELARGNETQRRLAVVEKEVDRLRKLEKALEDAKPKGTANRPLPEVFRELVLVRDAVASAGVSTKPEDVRRALVEGEKAKEVLRKIPDGDGAKLAEDNERLNRELVTLKAQMANHRRQAEKSGGRGLENPPCWATPSGDAEFIFDIALTSRGLRIRDRNLPNRTAERAELKVDSTITFEEELSPERFLAMTKPLFDWSEAHKCRFYVRAYDVTGPTEKGLYKRHMQTLEGRFYKYEVLNERF